MGLYTGDGCLPVKVTLAENINDDTMDRFVTALERIADSLARLAGLNRPRWNRGTSKRSMSHDTKASLATAVRPDPNKPIERVLFVISRQP